MEAVINNNIFPSGVLIRSKTALVLFAAGFGGTQDAEFVAEAGLRATCVDIRLKPLLEMRAKFPEDWDFVVFDAFEFPQHTHKMWDVVTVDVYTNDFERAAEMVGEWCKLAHHTVVLGSGESTHVEAPVGWRISERLQRSDYKGGVYWTVLERLS